MFEAQKVSTLYCSHKCNSKHYKLKKKLERKEQAEQPVKQNIKPKISAINKAVLMDKEFLSVKELALLFNCVPKTIYSMINAGIIPAAKLTERKTIIRRSDIDKLFE